MEARPTDAARLDWDAELQRLLAASDARDDDAPWCATDRAVRDAADRLDALILAGLVCP